MPPDSGSATVSRAVLVSRVRHASVCLHEEEDRKAVVYFAERAERVAAGAWNLDGCSCPSSAVGIDRFRMDAQRFAGMFDEMMGVDYEPKVYEVVDDSATPDEARRRAPDGNP